MAGLIGPSEMGEFPNFSFEGGNVSGWNGSVSIYQGDSYDGIGKNQYSMQSTGYFQYGAWNNGTRRVPTTAYIPVDPSKTYTLSYRVKCIQNASTGNAPAHYLGFATFDQFFNFIDLRNCGGIGNTTLTRPLNVGDAYAYIAAPSGYYVGADVTGNPYYFRHLCLYPPTHPYYSTPWYYTRVGLGEYDLYYRACEPTGNGTEHRLTLCDASNNPINYGYSAYPTPAGTPCHAGYAGGTYNYTFGYRSYNISEGWVTQTATFTGESRNSGQPFRQGTRYITSMILHNYPGNFGQDSITLWDRMLFIENNNNRYNFNS